MRLDRIVGTTALAALFLSAAGSAVRAEPSSLDFENTPVSDVVSQFHSVFGASIVLKNGVSPYRNVTFSVDSLSAPGARLEAVNDLAIALDGDYSKTFVISRVTDDATVSAPVVDSADEPVVFASTTVPAEDAIRLIAGVDDATAQFYAPIEGDVTLSSTRLTVGQAAREVSRQTHTQWKAFYSIVPIGTGGSTGSRVIDRTASGAPVMEDTLVTFRVAKVPPPEPTILATTAPTAPPGTAVAGTNTTAAVPPDYNPYTYPYGANPYAPNGGYGSNYPGYGYGGYNTSGMSFGYNAYGGYGPYGNSAYGGASALGNGIVSESPFGGPIVIGGSGQ